MTLSVRGLASCQIARDLRIAEATVKRHLANLYSELSAAFRSEATSVIRGYVAG